MWHVYILLCKNKALYTGVAKDVQKRFKDHLSKKVKYTAYNPPKKILYTKKFKTRSLAQKKESLIKALTRKEKWEIIKNS